MWLHMYMNLTYKGKSLVNSSTPGFSLEDAFLQEVWFHLHWCWLVVKVESQNDAHALLYVWDYYSIKLNAVFLLSGEVTCSLRTKGITALCRYSNWRLGSRYSVKTKKKVDPFHFFGEGKKAYESNLFVFSLSFSMGSSLNQFFVYWEIFVCFQRPLSRRAIRGNWNDK